jgi:hypothetical protein
LCVAALIGCAESPVSVEAVAHGPSATITTDQPSYTPGETMTVTWSGLPGNPNDWVGIAPDGSPATTVLQWVYTSGAAAGSANFYAPSTDGTYVARAFENDSYNLLANATFTVAASTGGTIATDQPTYDVDEPITVTWSGLPGNAHDWIAIAPAGSSPQTLIRWVYTNGAASGSTSFGGLSSAGNYVARAFENDGYVLLAESAFAVQAAAMATVTTDQATYTFDDQQGVVASWSGMPGAAGDFIALARAGSSLSTITTWRYTNSMASGSTTFFVPQDLGPYVIRMFVNNSYQLAGESAPFSMYVPVTVQGSMFFLNQTATYSWGHLGGSGQKQIVLAPMGSPAAAGTVIATTTQNFGSSQRVLDQTGTFVIRIRAGSILGESAPFTVTNTGPAVYSLANSYPWMPGGVGPVIISWVDIVPDGPNNWLAIVAPGTPDQPGAPIGHWRYITGSSGTVHLSSWLPPAGTWVARIYANDGYTKLAESSPFTTASAN